MLVLSRRRDESVLIGSDVRVTVVDIRPDGKVRLGIVAPRSVPVDREEVARAKKLSAALDRTAGRIGAK